MHRIRHAALAAALLVLVAAPAASAAGARASGFLPPKAAPLGYSLTELATAWSLWGWGGDPTTGPLAQVRCEQSDLDPRIWFLPVSLGGETLNTCDVPQGSFLVMFAGGGECSEAEPPPWHGSNEAELIQCVDAGFEFVSYAEVTVAGKTTTNLDGYVVTADMVNLPAGNVLSPDPTISMTKGIFLVVAPLRDPYPARLRRVRRVRLPGRDPVHDQRPLTNRTSWRIAPTQPSSDEPRRHPAGAVLRQCGQTERSGGCQPGES